MYCPSCGTEERSSNQFCRACGADLRSVMSAMAVSDSITASASAAREQIGQAIAVKIKDIRKVSELSELAEDVLPEIEKFLESPEEKRLRRMRNGTTVACIGLGVTLAFITASFFMDKDLIILAALGSVTLFIGISLFLNGYFLTVPKKAMSDHSSEGDSQRELDGKMHTTSELEMPAREHLFTSVTEGTTRHLSKKNKTAKDL